VVIPLPLVVVGGGRVVVVEILRLWPMIETQTHVSNHRPVRQSELICGLKRRKSALETPREAVIVSHVSPDRTKWKTSQFVALPGRYGVGVAIPLPAVVVVVTRRVVVVVNVEPPTTPTQMYVSSQTEVLISFCAGNRDNVRR